MDLFLEQYQITKDLYESDMNKRVAKYYLVTIPLKPANTVLLERMMVNLYADFKMSFLGQIRTERFRPGDSPKRLRVLRLTI